MSKNHVLLAFLCSFCFTLSVSADYIDGQRAYASGDYEGAILEWTQVAQDGNARAQYNLGWMHANGRGIAQDFQEAIKWYTKSAEQGNVNAQYNLGRMYLLGKGGDKNFLEARFWIKQALENNDEYIGALAQQVWDDYKLGTY